MIMQKKIISLAILGLIIFFLGSMLGFFYAGNITGSGQVNAENFLSSRVASFYASGTVEKIDRRSITLISGGDKLVVPVGNNVKVSIFVQPAGSNPYYAPAEFSQIKKGDHLNISLGLAFDKKIEGKEIYILTPAIGEKTKGF